MQKQKKKKKEAKEVMKEIRSENGKSLIGISADEKPVHGGSRHNSGRYPELDDPKRVLLNLEVCHTDFLDDYAKKKKLRGRSAAARLILDRYVKRAAKKKSPVSG